MCFPCKIPVAKNLKKDRVFLNSDKIVFGFYTKNTILKTKKKIKLESQL
jgi:hypothetical protein